MEKESWRREVICVATIAGWRFVHGACLVSLLAIGANAGAADAGANADDDVGAGVGEGEVVAASEPATKREADQAASTETTQSNKTAFPDHIEELLKEDKDTKTLADAPRCISTHRIRNTQVLDDRRVAFKMGRNAYYLVQLEQKCLGLKRGATISYSTSGQRLCKQDGIHAMVDFGPSKRLGPRCAIAGFVPVTKDFLDMVKDQLAQK